MLAVTGICPRYGVGAARIRPRPSRSVAAHKRSARDPLDLDGKSATGWLPEPVPRIGCFCAGEVLSWLWQASLVSQFADADSPDLVEALRPVWPPSVFPVEALRAFVAG